MHEKRRWISRFRILILQRYGMVYAMNKYIASLNGHVSRTRSSSSAKTKHSVSFAERLKESSAATTGSKSRVATTGAVTLVGEISRSRQTVSELLAHNSELKDSTWSILSSARNRNRDYTRLAVGTKVYYDRRDGSLSWSGKAPSSASVESAAPAGPRPAVQPVQFVNDSTSASSSSPEIRLGVITAGTPTVSHLLKAHPELGGSVWKILSSEVNRDKDFTALPVGTVVSIDPATREISWQGAGTGTEAVLARVTASSASELPASPIVSLEAAEAAQRGNDTTTQNSQAADLTEAVQPYLGTPYRELNCYELLVKGLERMNIRYAGKDGLFTKLTRMAREQGLAANAFLTGEGIIQAAGSKVFSRSISRVSNWQGQAEQLYREMEPFLDKGQILSFSTKHRGHTGIVSQQDNQWTFINSGRLDNSLSSDSPANGVGEEVLQREVRNWCRLASASGEPLTVTLGALGQDKVVASLSGRERTSGPRGI